MNAQTIHSFAIQIFQTMTAAEIQTWDRLAFVATFSHPAFTSYGDFLDLAECLADAVAQAKAQTGKARARAAA